MSKSELLRSGAEACYAKPVCVSEEPEPEKVSGAKTNRDGEAAIDTFVALKKAGHPSDQGCTPSGARAPPVIPKLAHTIPEAVRASGISRTAIYLAIGRGALIARKCGARTLILDSDLRRFLRSLPSLATGSTRESKHQPRGVR
jgi:hypothetical protein